MRTHRRAVQETKPIILLISNAFASCSSIFPKGLAKSKYTSKPSPCGTFCYVAFYASALVFSKGRLGDMGAHGLTSKAKGSCGRGRSLQTLVIGKPTLPILANAHLPVLPTYLRVRGKCATRCRLPADRVPRVPAWVRWSPQSSLFRSLFTHPDSDHIEA